MASESAQDERRDDAPGCVQGRRHSAIINYRCGGSIGRISALLHLPSPGEGKQRGFRPPREGSRLHPPHVCQGHRRWGATVLGEAGRAARNERCR
ncbi:MAG: hypothetical protein ACK56I_36010, partial [bacterium]